ncbi:DUF5987 family protein [Allokutzneria sp. A3M-2-11 16]|uniref:DUF5987 family protein n=1 Tax=Allokutzneria sp. A3M-2-11 16 TaxID=2962043 RepID=UPI0020B6531C|nr:DUF5987 family protein [Allokutzneria sp. A3M-2-11 16]MCP3802636.1 DUF5987 family protein [Allokutzneria sp. A3M-2-11 16]
MISRRSLLGLALVAPLGRSSGALEAFADTIVPGATRAGAMTVLRLPSLGLALLLPGMAALLDTRAVLSAGRPLAALNPAERAALVDELLRSGGLDREVYVLLALLCASAFDCAAHLNTAQAARSGHPGLRHLRFPMPDADGLWRFPEYSYGRRLAPSHPQTTAAGSPP